MLKRLFIVLLPLFAAIGVADDGYMSWGGAPKLLSNHKSIQMVSEKVVMTIYRDYAIVYCNFNFKNHGADCTVRMGFPDTDGRDTSEYPIYSSFDWFRSYVDGRRVKTYFLKGGGDGWQIKNVSFKRGQTRRVSDVYRIPLASGALNPPENANPDPKAPHWYSMYANYVLHTGASWKGVIETVEVLVRFAPSARAKGRIRVLGELTKSKENSSAFWRSRPDVVLVSSGPGKPTVGPRSMRFFAKNLEPNGSDDISLVFGTISSREMGW